MFNSLYDNYISKHHQDTKKYNAVTVTCNCFQQNRSKRPKSCFCDAFSEGRDEIIQTPKETTLPAARSWGAGMGYIYSEEQACNNLNGQQPTAIGDETNK